MATEPLVSPDVAAAPKVYSVPGAQTIRLLSVNASFTDNGAAGDWLPAVVVTNNQGEALVRAVDQGVKVTAGSDAEVSWFPGVKHAAASAPSATALGYARAWNDAFSGDAGQTVPAGTTRSGSFAHTQTTNAAIVSFSTSSSLNDTANLGTNGTYIMYVGTHWDVVSTSVSSNIRNSGAAENAFPHTPINPNTVPGFGDGIGSAVSQDFAVAHVAGGGYAENILHTNRLGVDQVVQQCYFVIIYLGTGV